LFFDTAGSGLTSSSSTVNVGAGSGIVVNADDVAMDINSLSSATIATGDFMPFWDITATADNKKILFEDFQAQITIVGTIATGTWEGTTIAINNGGTGGTSEQAARDNLMGFTTAGDMLFENAGGSATRLGMGAEGTVLRAGASVPAWSTLTADDISDFEIDRLTDVCLSDPFLDGQVLSYIGGSNNCWNNVDPNTLIDHSKISGLEDDDHNIYISKAPTFSTRNDITGDNADIILLKLIQGAGIDGNTDLFRVEDNNNDSIFRCSTVKLSSRFVEVSGNLHVINQKEFRLYESTANGSNYVGIQAASDLEVTQVYTWPTHDGEDGHRLQTDGSGTLTWNKNDLIGLSDVSTGVPDEGAILTYVGGSVNMWVMDHLVDKIGITVDGGGGVISTGSKGYLYMEYSGYIEEAIMIADVSGSCVIDVKKSSIGDVGSGVSICSGTKPTLSSQKTSQDAVLASWDDEFNAGDVFEFNVDSASTVKRVQLFLVVRRT